MRNDIYLSSVSAMLSFGGLESDLEVLCHQSACQLNLQMSLNSKSLETQSSSMSNIGPGPKQIVIQFCFKIGPKVLYNSV